MSTEQRDAIWQSLEKRASSISGQTIRSLFEDDGERFSRFSVEAAGLLLDYSKNKITKETLDDLVALAQACGLENAKAAMFAGEKINQTENRAVLHVALRDFSARVFHVDGENVTLGVENVRRRLSDFCARVHSGEFSGYSGRPLAHVVNIGIGGSDLGPLMAVDALRPYWIKGRQANFVSNVDGQHIADVLAGADPERTLFIVASKTFTTQETIANAATAKEWFLASGASEKDIAKHFVALSTNEKAATEFGIAPENIFEFWDWVGGRFSLWSAIGLSIALQVGYSNFEKLLRGAHVMDEHFRAAPPEKNMPVLAALVGIWNRNFIGANAHAILPYDQHLARFPAFLQQLDMESNGKSKTMDGANVAQATGPVVFGEPGTNGQHAFYQLLHQGTDLVSADFIASAISAAETGDHHRLLLSNFLAQTQAMMRGQTKDEARDALNEAGHAGPEADILAAHKTFPGDRPTNSILMEKLTPETLGALIALYEHKIFCQGVIWGINSFDQWGVELGKTLAKELLPKIAKLGGDADQTRSDDASTDGLINWINDRRGKA
ncbi:MAG: glucose-6-phosphate isomerase [Marinicaulis sp.]|nr:glucose-6-phosphate isomerase [Marinicaulis sp.]